MQKPSYARYRFPPVIIRHSVWLYCRFPLSYRDVEDMLAARGTAADQAYFVKCESETTTQEDIDAGRVIVHIGLATVKAAEFVILRIAQSVEQ